MTSTWCVMFRESARPGAPPLPGVTLHGVSVARADPGWLVFEGPDGALVYTVPSGAVAYAIDMRFAAAQEAIAGVVNALAGVQPHGEA